MDIQNIVENIFGGVVAATIIGLVVASFGGDRYLQSRVEQYRLVSALRSDRHRYYGYCLEGIMISLMLFVSGVLLWLVLEYVDAIYIWADWIGRMLAIMLCLASAFTMYLTIRISRFVNDARGTWVRHQEINLEGHL